LSTCPRCGDLRSHANLRLAPIVRIGGIGRSERAGVRAHLRCREARPREGLLASKLRGPARLIQAGFTLRQCGLSPATSGTLFVNM
jgi:hypothetical protein